MIAILRNISRNICTRVWRTSECPSLDLIQFHTWEDHWLDDERLLKAIDKLRSGGEVRAVGISINRWEPWNGVRAVKSGLIDAVQVIYNIFDQNPEDELFPACREKNVAVIARVPFDEGSLTGTLTKDSKWPARRLAEDLFCAGKFEVAAWSMRMHCSPLLRRWDEHAGDGAALHSEQHGCEHDYSGDAEN